MTTVNRALRSPELRLTASGTVVRVAVVHENEMFALGLQASLTEHFAVTIGLPGDGDRRRGRGLGGGRRRAPLACPLVVCGELNGRVAAGNDVVAELPRSNLSVGQLLACVHAASAGLRVSTAEAPHPPARLDRRGLDVVGLLAAGAGTREIAAELGLLGAHHQGRDPGGPARAGHPQPGPGRRRGDAPGAYLAAAPGRELPKRALPRFRGRAFSVTAISMRSGTPQFHEFCRQRLALSGAAGPPTWSVRTTERAGSGGSERRSESI